MARLTSPAKEHDRQAPAVAVEAISVRYNGAYALQDITFQLEQGKRVAVVGPNGAGKTTLFRVLAGTIRPDQGEVSIYGHGPGGHICIAYVPQRSQVDWTFPASVTDVVMMGRIRKIGLFRWPSPRDWRFVRSAMARVGIQDLGGRQIGDLSGGQQQRVFLAQALAQEAELVLLDEPLSGLDLPSQEAIFGILEQLSAEGVTVMVATHDLNMAADRFDRVLLLNRRLVAYGEPKDALTQPSLVDAYGGHVHLLESETGLMVLTDSCCDGEEHGTHD